MKSILYAMFALLSYSVSVFAEPVITKVELIDGNILEITGTGFGTSGANVEIYDTYENGEIAFNNLEADVGAWTSKNAYYHQTLVNDGYSGDYSVQVYDQIENKNAQATKVLSAHSTEVFVSFMVKIPSGSFFPCTDSGETLGVDSCWKFTWLMFGEEGYLGENDLCVPTYIGANQLIIAGNDFNPQDGGNIDLGITTWWAWDTWMRISTWLKADPVNPATVPGNIETTIVVDGIEQIFKSWNPIVFDNDQIDTPEKAWDRINIPGWIGSGLTNVRPLYDDIYVASGSNSRARVEIGNTSDIMTASSLSIQVPVSWSDNLIQVTLTKWAVNELSDKYLYIVDATGSEASISLASKNQTQFGTGQTQFNAGSTTFE